MCCSEIQAVQIELGVPQLMNSFSKKELKITFHCVALNGLWNVIKGQWWQMFAITGDIILDQETTITMESNKKIPWTSYLFQKCTFGMNF